MRELIVGREPAERVIESWQGRLVVDEMGGLRLITYFHTLDNSQYDSKNGMTTMQGAYSSPNRAALLEDDIADLQKLDGIPRQTLYESPLPTYANRKITWKRVGLRWM